MIMINRGLKNLAKQNNRLRRGLSLLGLLITIITFAQESGCRYPKALVKIKTGFKRLPIRVTASLRGRSPIHPIGEGYPLEMSLLLSPNHY